MASSEIVRNHAAHEAFWLSMRTKGKRGNVKHAIDAAVSTALSSPEKQIERLKAAIEEFGTSRVRDRVAKRVGCNHDILHDALQIEVRQAFSHIEGSKRDG